MLGLKSIHVSKRAPGLNMLNDNPNHIFTCWLREKHLDWDIYILDNIRSLWGPIRHPLVTSVTRLLHSLSLVAVGLTVRYETWPPIGWHQPFKIVYSEYRVGLPHLQCIMGSCDQWEFPLLFKGHWQSPCTALMAVSAVQGDCERV